MKKIWAMMLAILVSLGLIMPASATEVNVAKIGDKKYPTLEAAINEVTEGQTIDLLKDVDDAKGISVGSNKNFTIDFKGHTYTLVGPGAGSAETETNGFQLLMDSNITFKNGTIDVAEKPNNIKVIIQNYADLTLEDMTIKSQSNQVQYALSINNGDVTFKGDTKIKANNNMIAFDVCKFSNYPKVDVTFAEDYTGTIEGPIVYDSSNSETHKLNIKGNGTFANISYTERSEKAAKEGISIHSGTFKTVEALKYLEENAKVTVKLDKNVNESIVIPKNTNVTLDLNGKNITNTDGQHTILNKGNLTIVGEGEVNNISHKCAALCSTGKNASVVVKGGEFTRSKEAGKSPTESGNNSWYVISNEAGSKMTIENANVHSTGKHSSLVRNYGTMNITGGEFENGFITIKNEEDSKLNITGGKIISSTQAIQSYGDTTITGGKLTGQVTVSKYDKFDSIINITGGEVSGDILVWDDSKATGKVNATVDGAHITGDLVIWNENKQPIQETDELNIDVKSGTFDKNVSTYVVNERGLIKVDGTYYVDEAKVLNEVASKASKSVEILKGIDTISVPAGVEVTNNSGDDVVVNGEVLANGQKVTVTNKETVNMTLAAVINGKVIAGEDLVELMKLGGVTNITVDDLTEKVEKGYALTKEEVAELEEVMKQFKDEELVFKGFFVDKDGKVKLDESYVFDKDTTVYMIFETKDGDMSVVPTPGDKPNTKPTQKEETVKTDDESNMTLYASFAGLALVGGAIIILNKKREELMK